MFEETVFARRASAILYNLALSRGNGRGHYLLPANVCPVVPLALLKAGCVFEFIDIDPDTLCMDDRLLQARIEAPHLPPVAGVVYVRTYGFERDMTTLFRQLKTYAPETCLIDDRCASRPEPDKDSVDRQGRRCAAVQHRLFKICGPGHRRVCAHQTGYALQRARRRIRS